MQIISPPVDWKRVPEADFIKFLSMCFDYTRTGYVGAEQYSYRYNGECFAIVLADKDGEKVYVRPDLLS